MLSKSQIQHVKSLRSKKFRQKYNQFIIEGEKAVNELLDSRLEIEHIYATAVWADSYKKAAEKKWFTLVKNDELERLSGFEQPNKVLAVAKIPDTVFSDEVFNQPITIVLDNIQDPGNLGTIIRIADWYGINDIVCSENTTDVYNPKVINATMGSFLRVNVHYVNLEEVLEGRYNTVYACVMDGEPVYKLQKFDKAILLIGNEGKGVSKSLLEKAGHKISIPARGKAESLNAAVATAVVVDNLVRILP